MTSLATTGDPTADRALTLRKDLHAIYWDGVCWALMVGLGETYFAAFVLAAGGREVMAGLVVTLPMVLGAVLQLAAPWGVRQMGSHRGWVALTAGVQAAAFVPMVVGAACGVMPLWAAYLCVMMYFAGGMAAGAPWVALVGAIVPGSIRANYFAQRTRAIQAGTLAGLVVGGTVLQLFIGDGKPLSGFIILFSLACLCRAVSTYHLTRYSDPHLPVALPRLDGGVPDLGAVLGWLRGHRGKSDLRVLYYMLAVQVAVQVSSPFFAPYMIRQLEFSPALYMAMVGTVVAAKMAAFPLFGLIAKRHGPTRLLWIGGLGLIPASGLWALADNLAYLFALQILSGTMWAAYELATFLLHYERIHEDERTTVMTLFNLGNALAIAAGSICGGWLLVTLKTAGGVGAAGWAYGVVFVVSSVLRGSTVILLLRLARRGPTSAATGTEAIEFRTVIEGFDRPSVPSLPHEPTPAAPGGREDRAAAPAGLVAKGA